ncbi:MAG TPA: adenylate/guanylate cyclase domain-containing protein [Chthonomonadaceae bacterium]|nr:adenylate/guanylate cyclase domain-containing protein [Chthonomonadaceae bacterium]
MPAANPTELENLTRLLLEDVCCDLVRLLHAGGDPARLGAVRIDREWALGPDGSFADLRVEPEDDCPYFLEVKSGFDPRTVLAHIQRKYGRLPCQGRQENRVVLVTDATDRPDWPAVEPALQAALPPALQQDIWGPDRLRGLFAEAFGQDLPALTDSDELTLRERIDQAKDRLAFGEETPVSYGEAALRQNLLWHFGSWRLRELRHKAKDVETRDLVPPGTYENVVVLLADLSGFSAYMHDTSDDAIVRHVLTSFYAKARYQIINAGGMLLQFLGDAVVALFGIPDHRPGYLEAALHAGVRLLDIAASVSHDWQRRIDHVQPRRGAHISLAMGRVQLVAMRPLDPARLAGLGDCLDIAQRLSSLAEPGEIVISNVLRYALRDTAYEFAAMGPTEVRHLGTLQPWKLVQKTSIPPQTKTPRSRQTKASRQQESEQ